MTIRHSKKDYVSLDDIFVYPDIKCLDGDLTIKKYKWTVKEIVNKYNYIYFLGSEECGKTTLMKKLAMDCLEEGFNSIVLDASELNNIDLNILVSGFNKKYGLNVSLEDSNNVLFIDNFSKQRFKDSYLDKFLKEVTEKFKKVYIFVDKNSFYTGSSKYLKFNFQDVEILNFGYSKRNELYKKWYSIGEDVDFIQTDNNFYSKIDALSTHFDALMKKNVMDSRPIYILTIIQTLENMSNNNSYQLTSYGQCYYVLLTGMLKRANISLTNDLDGFLNFLSFLAYYLYQSNLESLSNEEFFEVIKIYDAKYIAPKNIKEVLLDSGILITPDNDSLQFSQKYLYYFCCAKYLSDNASDLSHEITLICKNMHNENKANILIFLVHHLRSTDILQEILSHAICLMDGTKPFEMSLKAYTDFKSLLGDEIQKIVFEDKNSEEQRKIMFDKMDQLDEQMEDPDFFDISIDEKDLDITKNELEQRIDFELFQQSTSSIRSIEVLGQIAKNRHSSINRSDLNDILMVAYDNGLKVLNFYLSIFKDTEKDLKDFIKSIIADKKQVSPDEAKKMAEKVIHQICFSVCLYIIQLISKSTAHTQLLKISENLTENKGSPAYYLVDLYSRLIISKELPKSLIKKIKQENYGNSLVYSLLQQLVIGHLYLHNVDYKDKQWIQDHLEIKVADQLRAASNTALKQLN